MVRQRSLQKGNSGSPLLTTFLQIGQRSLRVRLGGMLIDGRKTHLDNSGYQIVIVRFGNLAAIELARLRLRFIRKVVHENFAVDFWGVH